MQRRVERELLDELPQGDPKAIASRQDLRRLNRLMGNVQTVTTQLRTVSGGSGRRVILDLGAGDGQLMLNVARCLGSPWQGSKVILLDKQPPLNNHIEDAFARVGWTATFCRGDITRAPEWPEGSDFTAIVTNLFLHHFLQQQLRELFGTVQNRTACFVAVEPRRTSLALLASRLVGFIGCNAITRHDAPTSVRAGFKGQELSALWPTGEGWECLEKPAGLFSQLFVARKRTAR